MATSVSALLNFQPIISNLALLAHQKTVDNALIKTSRKYTIVDAIKDENILKFPFEYVGRYKELDSDNEVDIDVEGINTKELRDSPKRLEK